MTCHFHHGRDGRGATPEQFADGDREVWCPNVGEWMTQAEHRARFAPAQAAQ